MSRNRYVFEPEVKFRHSAAVESPSTGNVHTPVFTFIRKVSANVAGALVVLSITALSPATTNTRVRRNIVDTEGRRGGPGLRVVVGGDLREPAGASSYWDFESSPGYEDEHPTIGG